MPLTPHRWIGYERVEPANLPKEATRRSPNIREAAYPSYGPLFIYEGVVEGGYIQECRYRYLASGIPHTFMGQDPSGWPWDVRHWCEDYGIQNRLARLAQYKRTPRPGNPFGWLEAQVLDRYQALLLPELIEWAQGIEGVP